MSIHDKLPGSGAKQSVKWKAGAIIAPPLNSWRVHINRGTQPLRFLCMTNAPVVIDLFHNNDFVFNNDYAFRERFNGEADFFGPRISARELSAIPNSRATIIADAGHFVFVEAPGRFRAEVLAFLEAAH